jgi:membrane-associated phospholipid phosphatase
VSGPAPLWRRAIFALRPEEFATLLLFLPMALTLALMSGAHAAARNGPGAGYPGALPRLFVMLAATAFLLFVVRVKPQWRFVRDALPFLYCASIYASLHDLIRFYSAPDITGALYRWDVALFGFEPTIWAEQFANPFLTDYFTVCYWLFYVLAPLLGLLLYLRKDYRAFRYTMVSVVLCLYLGYIGYVAWPASAPRLFIPGAYSVPLHGLPLLDYTRIAAAAVPLTAYGAFPSLHCAVALLAVMLAWRFLRWFFWFQVPFAAGLIIGTVYLRHHWVVDILAGFVLTFLAYWAGPKLEDWWSRQASSGEGWGRPDRANPVNPSLSTDPAEARKRSSASRVAAKVMES